MALEPNMCFRGNLAQLWNRSYLYLSKGQIQQVITQDRAMKQDKHFSIRKEEIN